ncbi:hypothetical protein HN873_039103 [Arachis hypogaea]
MEGLQLAKTQDPLFSYPSSYGEHKYAVSTTRSTCTSPIFFSDYLDVVKEIKNLIKDSSSAEESSALRYMLLGYQEAKTIHAVRMAKVRIVCQRIGEGEGSSN